MSETKGVNLFNDFLSNKDLEQDGVPLLFGKNAKGDMISLTIRRAGGSNTAFTKRYDALMKPYRRLEQMGKLDPDVQREIMHTLYAETVVAGWSGVLDSDNKTELAFSVEACKRLFEVSEQVFSEVVNTSMNAAVYRDEVREEDAKN